jgi:hypothetical protein
VNRSAIRLYGLVLYAYPAEFREEYANVMVQTLLDRHKFEAVPPWRLVWREVFDAARVAPQMRWESPMNRIIIIAVLATVAVAATGAVGPVVLIPIAAVALAVSLWWSSQNRPVAAAAGSRRGLWWLAAGVAGIGTGIAIPAIDGGELNGFWWTVMAVSLLAGIAMTVAGVVIAINDRSHQSGEAAVN